uniref:Uncharacterized protein n=1 Tax=Anguilla anguilla TaxID=7936 RepID=A0A0E9RXT6_ANGAN
MVPREGGNCSLTC